jgi:hypothetical protein
VERVVDSDEALRDAHPTIEAAIIANTIIPVSQIEYRKSKILA